MEGVEDEVDGREVIFAETAGPDVNEDAADARGKLACVGRGRRGRETIVDYGGEFLLGIGWKRVSCESLEHAVIASGAVAREQAMEQVEALVVFSEIAQKGDICCWLTEQRRIWW